MPLRLPGIAFYINNSTEQPELPFCSDLSSNSLKSILQTFRVTLSMLSYQTLKCPGQSFKVIQNLLCTNHPCPSNLALRRTKGGLFGRPLLTKFSSRLHLLSRLCSPKYLGRHHNGSCRDCWLVRPLSLQAYRTLQHLGSALSSTVSIPTHLQRTASLAHKSIRECGLAL